MVGVGKDGKRTDIGYRLTAHSNRYGKDGYRASSTFPTAHSWERDPNPILNQLHTGGPVHVRQGAAGSARESFWSPRCLSSQQV